MSQREARALPTTDVTEIIKAPFAFAQGRRRSSSSVFPDLLKRTRISAGPRIPMSPWSASTGERNEDRMPRETRVWEILFETKPDFPTPEKKIVPEELRRIRVNASVWVRSRFWKK